MTYKIYVFWFCLILAACVSAQMYPQYTWQPPYFSRRPPGAPPPHYAPPGPATCNVATCQLPDCFCPGKDAPGGLERKQIPQIVMFTFDDAINEQVRLLYFCLLLEYMYIHVCNTHIFAVVMQLNVNFM